jgi:hypothetical protein
MQPKIIINCAQVNFGPKKRTSEAEDICMSMRLTPSGAQTFIVSDIPAARQNKLTMVACGLAELT